MAQPLTVTDNLQASRYEGRIEGELAGFCDYRRSGDDFILPHTETLPAYRGRGVADAIVKVAIADARKAGLNIIPRCWFVEEFPRRNPA
jgi:predicted GNAT family acetyltransferase